MGFTKRERKLFKWHDGSKWHGIDPLEADIALDAVDLDWEAQFLSLRLGESSAAVALVDATRKIFKLPELTIAEDGAESGMTSVDVLDLLGTFISWRQELRDFFGQPPTSQPSTDGAAAVTESGSDSTSTSPVSSPGPVSP